jgi:DNA-binding NarL/FixJ family response regulator
MRATRATKVACKTSSFAIEEAQNLHPDLILLDLSMPAMNRLDAARALTQLMPEVPFIMYSVLSDSFIQREVRSAGVSALVSKSEHISVLLRQGAQSGLRDCRLITCPPANADDQICENALSHRLQQLFSQLKG